MSYGKLASGMLNVPTTTVMVYEVPSHCHYAKVNINILNTSGSSATLSMGIGVGVSPDIGDMVEDGVVIEANGGILGRKDELLSPGEKIFLEADQAGVSYRITGILYTSIPTNG